jgi:hypothetical protein
VPFLGIDDFDRRSVAGMAGLLMIKNPVICLSMHDGGR